MKLSQKTISPENILMTNDTAFLEVIESKKEITRQNAKYAMTFIDLEMKLKELQELLPDNMDLINNLDDKITEIENLAFTSGYKFGMLDISTSLVLNEANITGALYPVMGKQSKPSNLNPVEAREPVCVFKKLEDRIRDQGYTKGEICKELGISRQEFNSKLAGETDFTFDEMELLTKILCIADEEITEFLFSELLEVRKKNV